MWHQHFTVKSVCQSGTTARICFEVDFGDCYRRRGKQTDQILGKKLLSKINKLTTVSLFWGEKGTNSSILSPIYAAGIHVQWFAVSQMQHFAIAHYWAISKQWMWTRSGTNGVEMEKLKLVTNQLCGSLLVLGHNLHSNLFAWLLVALFLKFYANKVAITFMKTWGKQKTPQSTGSCTNIKAFSILTFF